MYFPPNEFNYKNIAQQLAQGMAAIDAGQTIIEFGQTKNIDSSSVACLLAWKRRAQELDMQLEFKHLPTNLTNLINLYGVAEFL